MSKLRFSLLHLVLGTFYVAVCMAAVKHWRDQGALLVPCLLYLSLVSIVASVALRRYLVARFLLPHLLAMCLVTSLLILSFGPVVWWMTRYNTDGTRYPTATRVIRAVYSPIATTYQFVPEPIHGIGYSYLDRWLPDGMRLWDIVWGFGWRSKQTDFLLVR